AALLQGFLYRPDDQAEHAVIEHHPGRGLAHGAAVAAEEVQDAGEEDFHQQADAREEEPAREHAFRFVHAGYFPPQKSATVALSSSGPAKATKSLCAG